MVVLPASTRTSNRTATGSPTDTATESSAIDSGARHHLRVGAALTVLVSAGCAALGYVAMFSAFNDYDDEGYALVMLREFGQRGALFDSVFSQYGPFYFLVYGVPARLGLEWSVTTGRFVSLAIWVLTALLVGLVVLVLSRSTVLALLAVPAAFFLLETMTWEPMHPGGLICLAIVGMIAAPVLAGPRFPRASTLVIGVLAAGLALTKINVGIVAVLALAFTVLAARPRWRAAPALRVAVDVALIAVGPLLILSNGMVLWKLIYAVVYVSAAGALVLASRSWDEGPEPRPLRIRELIIGAAGTAAVTVASSLATGTTVSSLVHGTLVRPLDQVKVVVVPLAIPLVFVGWLLLLPALRVGFRRLAHGPLPTPTASVVASLRVAGGVLLVAGILGVLPVSPMALLPLCILAAVPPTVDRAPTVEPTDRRLLVALAVLNSIQAYPVAGAQVSFGLLPALICGIVAVGDGIAEWRRIGEPDRATRAVAVGGPLLLFSVVLLSATTNVGAWISRYGDNVDPGLAGTARLRFPAETAAALRFVDQTVRDNCAAFVTDPGMNSFYIYSDRRPPTGYNPTLWRRLLNPTEQQAVVTALQKTNGNVCLVRHSPWFDSFARFVSDVESPPLPPDPPGPLVDYLASRQWRSLGSNDGYEVLVAADP